MNETELIQQIKKLKEIKPRKDWVLLTKKEILREETKFELFPFFRPVYAGLFLFLFVVSVFQLSQRALPGDVLYPLKRISEKAQAIFVSDKELPKYNLELANKRLQELTQIAKKNEVKKLAPAINEFQANVSEAAKNLAKVQNVDKEIVEKAQRLEENKEKVEGVLGTNIGDEEYKEYENSLAKLVENQIKDLEQRTLTDEQKEILAEVKLDFEAGNYTDALVKILILTQ